MILLSAQNLEKTYMERKVLDDVSFFLGEGDKVGIIGINGTGKSTLLRILAGAEEPDSGTVIRTKGVRVSYLPQIPEFDTHGSVLEQVMAHLPLDLKAAKEFEAKSILGKLGIADYDRDISTLSGGERRRVGIAAALIQPSDVLLLDEPTNHIDNDTVQLLEEQLRKYRGAIVMVTHDRYFLNRITQKIVEVDRGKIFKNRVFIMFMHALLLITNAVSIFMLPLASEILVRILKPAINLTSGWILSGWTNSCSSLTVLRVL